jgi:hypothetical protein
MEELTIDQAVEMLNGTQQAEVTTEVETTNNEPEQAEQVETQEEVEGEVEQEEVKEEPSALDYNLKVKFKANGVEQEKSIQDLINDAQLASNYNQKMQELATQRKAFDAAMQQQQQTVKEDPAKTFEELKNAVTARAMKMLGIDNVEDFAPDAMGLMGSKVHYAAYQKALLDIQQEQQSAEYAKQQERAVEDKYASTVHAFAADPKFQEINKYAEQALFQLPTKGPEGIKQFQSIYSTYQKIQQREQHYQETQAYGRSNVQLTPFTANEIDALTKFYGDCKAEYTNTQTKAQVKAQVPKSVPIKPTVRVEATSDNTPAAPRKVDFKKIQSMDLDDIAKLL